MKRLRGWLCRTSLPLLPVVLVQVIFVFVVLFIVWVSVTSSDNTTYAIILRVAADGTLQYQKGNGIYDLKMNLLYTLPELYDEQQKEQYRAVEFASLWLNDWDFGGLWSHWQGRQWWGENESWFLLEDDGYIAGYDKRTGRGIGYLGANGYSRELNEVARFSGVKRHRYASMLATREGIFNIQPKSREVQMLLPPIEQNIIDYELFNVPPAFTRPQPLIVRIEPRAAEDSDTSYLAVLMDSAVAVYGDSGILAAKIALPLPLKNDLGFGVRIGMSDSGIFYLQQPADTYTVVRTVTRDGRLLLDTMVANREEFSETQEVGWIVGSQPGIIALFVGFGTLFKSPEMSEGVVKVIPLSDYFGIALWWVVVLFGALWLYRRHLRHQTLPRWQKLLWALAWFMFPFFAPFVYFGALDWPRLVKCPNCGQRRPLDRDLCPHCAAAFPRQPAKGIELIVS